MALRRPVYIYLLNVPSFSSRYFYKIKRTSRLGRLLALSLEILRFSVRTLNTNRESYFMMSLHLPVKFEIYIKISKHLQFLFCLLAQ